MYSLNLFLSYNFEGRDPVPTNFPTRLIYFSTNLNVINFEGHDAVPANFPTRLIYLSTNLIVRMENEEPPPPQKKKKEREKLTLPQIFFILYITPHEFRKYSIGGFK